MFHANYDENMIFFIVQIIIFFLQWCRACYGCSVNVIDIEVATEVVVAVIVEKDVIVVVFTFSFEALFLPAHLSFQMCQVWF